MSNYQIDTHHPFFSEVLQFVIATTSMTLAIRQQVVEDAIHKVIAESRKMAHSFNTAMPYNSLFIIDVPPLDKDITLVDLSCSEMCVLENVAQLTSFIRNESGQPDQLKFRLEPRPAKGLPTEKSNIQGQLTTPWVTDLSCYLLGGAFERYRDHYELIHGGDKLAWNPEMQFFRHLRNGCFHGNIFNIEQLRIGRQLVNQIDPANPPRWQSYVMPSDNAMNGQKAIDGFCYLPHIPAFLYDMGKYV